MILVTFALPAESSDFVALLRTPERLGEGKHDAKGLLGDREVGVLHTGVGQTIAHARVAAFLQSNEKPSLLVSAGFAGALREALDIGDVLWAENFSEPRFHALLRALPCVPGTLATASNMIDTPADREALAQTGADAVDMETETLAALASEAGIPFLSLRGISDTPAAPFPVPPAVLFDVARQKTDFTILALYLLRHPAAIPRLLAFAKNVATARRALTNVLERVLTGALP